MMAEHPTPWHLVGQTIRDAAGYVVVSALNPCGMATRQLIVDAVNSSSLAGGAMEKPQTESPNAGASGTGEYVDRASDLEIVRQKHGASRAGNCGRDVRHGSAIDLGTDGCKHPGGLGRSDRDLAADATDFSGANEYECR